MVVGNVAHVQFRFQRLACDVVALDFNTALGNGLNTDQALNRGGFPRAVVPDKPEQLTSNSGWDTEKEQLFLRDVLNELREAGIRSSIFIDADVRMAEFAAEAGADRVELYTGPYAHGYATDRDAAIAPFLETAKRVRQLGIGLNAGHDLSLENLKFFTDVISWVDEVSIGHALICDALYMGLEATIAAYKNCLIK